MLKRVTKVTSLLACDHNSILLVGSKLASKGSGKPIILIL